MRGRLAAALCGGAVVAGAIGGHLMMPLDLAAASPTHPAPVARTGRYAPSQQWLHADLASRGEAYALMVGMVGHEQTCMADVAHSYRGAVKNRHRYEDFMSSLHPGKHYVMSGYVKGVCDQDPDSGFYAGIR